MSNFGETDIKEVHVHVMLVPCHNGMVCQKDVDGGNCLQIWGVAVNTMNKQMANMGWSSNLRVGW